MIRYNSILLSICVQFAVQGQHPIDHFQPEFRLHVGKIIKHSKKFAFPIPLSTQLLEISLLKQTTGNQLWEQDQHYPGYGASLIFGNLGDGQRLGYAFGFYPFVRLHFTSIGKKGGLAIRAGSGVAWLTKRYDPLTNQENTAIGSHINNVTNFQLESMFDISQAIQLQLGISLTHFSNGVSKQPNLGLNIPAAFAGVFWSPNRIARGAYQKLEDTRLPWRRWGAEAFGSIAWTENYSYGGPRFPVYSTGLSLTYQSYRSNRFIGGVHYELKMSEYYFGLETYSFSNPSEAKKGASRIMLSLGNEFIFHRMSVVLQAGTYVGGFSKGIPYPWYSKLSMRYYLPILPEKYPALFFDISLKAHHTNADYISWGGGVHF